MELAVINVSSILGACRLPKEQSNAITSGMDILGG